ncbi:hypothetical protein CR513_42971, partial [Mucuna pruriens]
MPHKTVGDPHEVKRRIMGHSREDWCEFHRAAGHSTEGCWTLKTQLEKLVQEGHLNQYIHGQTSDAQGDRGVEGETMNTQLEGPREDEVGQDEALPPSTGAPSLLYQEERQHPRCRTGLRAGARRQRSNLVITFDDPDLRHGAPKCDEPMVISVIAAEYKIERVLIDQGSSVNILMGLPHLMECQGTLYGFESERVLIKGTVELETMFGDRSGVRTILILYMVVDAEASYNISMRQPALNRLGAVVSTYHLCMKFPVGQGVGSVWADSGVARRCYEDNLRVGLTSPGPAVNALDLNLDPRHLYENERPHPIEDLKEVQIGPLTTHVTKIGTTLGLEEEARLANFLKRNVDVFAWTTKDMPGIDPDFVSPSLGVMWGQVGGSEKKKVRGGKLKGRYERNEQIAGGRLHQGGTVSDLDSQCSDG